VGKHWVRRRRRPIQAAIGTAFAVLVLVLATGSGRAAGVSLSIKVQGNHFVDGAGKTIRLLGVNHPSFEYACEEGYAYDDGNMDAADAAAIASWHATAVRVPLNEDCWLGVNGEPSNFQDPQPPLTVAGYRRAVENYPNRPVSWECWRSGGCLVPQDNDSVASADDTRLYTAVGMQALVDAIRSTGAHQPIMLGGLNYSNDLTGWLAHEPSDPGVQLAASFHNYQGLGCDTQSCWDAQVAAVASHVPVGRESSTRMSVEQARSTPTT
jgi:hypothetical protein